MPLIDTPDGHYTHAVTTANEGDGNDVVYDNWIVPGQKTPVWDKFSYEASLGHPTTNPQPPSHQQPTPTLPPATPSTPLPPTTSAMRIIQVTDGSDGDFEPRMYSYWPNAFVTGSRAFVFAGHVDGRPRFFDVDLASGSVKRLGALLGFTGTTEGWYFDAQGWVYLIDGTRLRRASPFSQEAPVVFDIADTHPGCDLWQAHSSEDGQTHSATVRRISSDGPYQPIGTVVFRRGRQDFFPAQGKLDESQVDASGRWLIIKEDDDNRIIDLDTRETRMITDADGAVGHSDCGDGILVGEDNIRGACVLWDLRGPLMPSRRRELFKTWNQGYISIRGGRCLHSDDAYLALVDLNGGGEQRLLDHAIVNTNYDDRVKANLDPSGRVACYMLNNGVRRDVFLAVLPG